MASGGPSYWEHIEADDNASEGDTDSAFSGSIYTTSSLASSIRRFQSENGRTYHSYKEGSYVLPNDERERDRLGMRGPNPIRILATSNRSDLQHQMFNMTFGDKLALAPVGKDPQNVLDVGTGTGLWAIDFADAHPSSRVVGTDLSPIQPSFVPPNLEFQIDDAESDWTFNQKFDFIHGRMLTASFEDWPKFFDQAYRALAPGGWLELQDTHFPMGCDDGTYKPDHALWKWNDAVVKGCADGGRPITAPTQYKKQMEAVGFVDVVECDYKWPCNTWPKDKDAKVMGAWNNMNMKEGLQGMSLAVMTRTLGWSKEEVEVHLIEVRKNLNDTKIHVYWPIKAVYGRRPETDKQK